MQIILNNTAETIPGDEMTVNELIRYKNFTFRLLVTKVNEQLVKTDQRDQAKVRSGDRVQVLHMISGG
ncbi:MAG: sulfur carrier protein ThiS [Bacteroidales bacterium]|nr:sulfur carrier protein ThiS [Bacteroidales bacterium]